MDKREILGKNDKISFAMENDASFELLNAQGLSNNLG